MPREWSRDGFGGYSPQRFPSPERIVSISSDDEEPSASTSRPYSSRQRDFIRAVNAAVNSQEPGELIEDDSASPADARNEQATDTRHSRPSRRYRRSRRPENNNHQEEQGFDRPQPSRRRSGFSRWFAESPPQSPEVAQRSSRRRSFSSWFSRTPDTTSQPPRRRVTRHTEHARRSPENTWYGSGDLWFNDRSRPGRFGDMLGFFGDGDFDSYRGHGQRQCSHHHHRPHYRRRGHRSREDSWDNFWDDFDDNF